MSISKRLKALEDRLHSEPIVATLPDGNIAIMPAKVRGQDHVAALLGAAVRSERFRELDLIRTAVCFEEPDGGHMCELAQAILLSPQ